MSRCVGSCKQDGATHHTSSGDICHCCKNRWPCLEKRSRTPHQKSPSQRDDYCICCLQTWPCKGYLSTEPEFPHQKSDARYGVANKHKCLKCQEEWPCKAVRESRIQVAIFDVLPNSRTSEGVNRWTRTVSVRADNVVSMTLSQCNTGCVDKSHWIVETKGLGGIPRKFEGKLRSIG